jgi:hypothetical protein
LEKFRKAAGLLRKIREKYESHPTQVKRLLEDACFHDIDITRKIHKVIISSSQTYVEMMLSGGLNKAEFSEMRPDVRDKFSEEVITELERLVSSEGLVMDWEVIYFTGIK